MANRFIQILILIVIASTLVNSNAFGSPTLIAYFVYSLLACLVAVITFLLLLLNKFNYKLPPYIASFVILSLYVGLHGLIINNVGLSHFYWGVNAIFISSINIWVNKFSIENADANKLIIKKSNPTLLVHSGILLLAIIESAIVLLQCVNLFPTPTNLFLCTGTWINPNVTAMFLALSLFSLIKIKNISSGKLQKLIVMIALGFIVVAIMMLQCRSAYVVAAIILIFEYYPRLKNYVKKNLHFNFKGFALIVYAIVIIQIVFAVFGSKEASTNSRIQIWKSSMGLINEEPVFGYGFGMFERTYNLYAAERKNLVNDHVNMAYNDFIELSIEGGLIAVLLWVLFLFQVWKVCCNKQINNELTPVLISFISIQITNFGFQAIPVMALFLFYIGSSVYTKSIITLTPINEKQSWISKKGKYFKVIYSFLGIVLSILLLFHIMTLTGAFYKKWIIVKDQTNVNAVGSLKRLQVNLNNFSSYHESLGDAYIKEKKLRPALDEYLAAMKTRSEPELFIKTGFCYQLGSEYDSSEYYYSIVQKMQPQKLLPRFYLLNLYVQKADTLLALIKAKEIITMQVKIKNKKAIEMKKYAKSIIDSLQ